jgi:peptidoglycan hydrolase-like protein with peptidoglycan-binding domain
MAPAILLGVAAVAGLGLFVVASKARAKDATAPDEDEDDAPDDSANKEVNVRKMQELLNKLIRAINADATARGAAAGIRMLQVDGKFGPNTSAAWAAQAERLEVPPVAVGSVGATTARVNDRAAVALSNAAAAIVEKTSPTPHGKTKPAPKPDQGAPKPAPQPTDAQSDYEAAKAAAEKAKRLEEQAKPAPAPPKPSAPVQKVAVQRLQEILVPLGQALTVDGNYGPKTETAYKTEAQRRGLASNIVKVKNEKNSAGKFVQVVQVDKAALGALVDASVKAERAAKKAGQKPQPVKQARHELINNAIVKLDFATPATPTGTRKAVNDLFNHWQKEYWGKGYRDDYPQKLDNYAAWYTRAWRMVTPAVQQNVPHPKTIDPSYVETPKPTPSPGAEQVSIPVLRAQELLNRHGAGLQPDGKYGPITAGAWQKLATQHKVSVRFERLDPGTSVKVDAEALRKLEALPASQKASPPPGYDRAKAKARARDVSAHLKKQGRAYDKSILKSWQTQAGIGADGLYGPHSRNALVYYGATDAPAPFVKGTEKPYVPPA